MVIDFAFDYASPWAFLASASASERFRGLAVSYLPVYLRGFEAFRDGMPYVPAKLAYLLQDFQRQADQLGLTVKLPSSFPINGVHALRGAIVAQREGVFEAYHRAVFAAAWQEDRNISSKDVVREVAREVGSPQIADALEDPAIKELLRASTERAVARGAFGVPIFFVGDQVFWGQDRMLDAARLARRERSHGAPRTAGEAWAFARRWASAWSRLDVEEVLAQFSEETVFESPLAKKLTGSARVTGKAALRAYWTEALKTVTAMRFDVIDVSWSPADRYLVVVYDRTRNETLARCTEHMRFDEHGHVSEGRAFHGA